MSSKTNLRKLAFSVLALALSTQISFAQEVYRGISASEIINDAQVVRTSQHSSLPSFVKFNEGKEVDFDALTPWLKKNFQLAPGIGWKLIGTEEDHHGDVHYRYQQTWNGVPVDAAILIAHTKSDKVYSINGNFYQNFVAPSSTGMSETTALNAAMDHVGAESYKWEQPEEEEYIKWEQADESASFFPTGELVLVSEDLSYRPESFKLAWKFNIYAHEPISRSWIYIDVASGEVLQDIKILVDADEPGTAETQYSGNQTIIADSFSGGYRLRDGSRGDGVRTFDMNEGTTYGSSVDFEDLDNYWDNYNPEQDEYATDAHWGTEMTYDYFWFDHGRNSIDDAGFQLNSYVHYSTDYTNAFWDGTRMTYGDGSGGYSPLTSMDIVAHEITHGLCDFTANLTYSYESGALNESFSDIFGTAVENYSTPSDWDWLIGEDIGSAFRSMSNPGAFGHPDTYLGTNWWYGAGDSGGVHTNSGVQNFWYYVLNNGDVGTNDNGDSYDVTGQGWTVASAVAFRNLTVYLIPSSQYADARFYAIQSAIDLYGACSPEVEAVTDAWYAVGVGPAYTNEVIAEFNADVTTSGCFPFTVDFTNTSINGSSFSWDFGDGGTSTETNPSHSYTAEGLYTVSLIADGGACGTDDTIIVDYINLDSGVPCEITMPSSGTEPTLTNCTGTVFDSGGEFGDYGASELSIFTISPTGASTIDLDFVFFDVESGTSGGVCDYDRLEVYDGPTTASPLIDTYCNTNTPPASLTSTNGSITLLFSSDTGLEEAGFQIDWSCNLPTVVPNTDFVANTTTTCNGVVSFTDLTTEGPLTWDWDFGDGGTSTDQNPTYTYSADGSYTVTLTTTNGVGSDDEIKTFYIDVDLPDAPIGTEDTICSGASASLDAIGAGTMTWYTVPVGGSPIFTGAPYATPPLISTTSYWVEDVVDAVPVNEGPVDNSFGGGGFFSGDQYLIFDVTAAVVLNTVKVYANGTASRTIELRDNVGTVLESIDVVIADGEQIVTLDWDLPVGTNYQLGTQFGSAPDMYRNNSGPSYPYNVSGMVEITNSSAGTDYYYHFYDWELQEYPCVSPRTEVEAFVGVDTTILIDPIADVCSNDAPITVTTGATGGSWDADCGGCIDAATGSFDPSAAGAGVWTIDYVIPGYCGSSSPATVTVEGYNPVSLDATSPICHEGGVVTLTGSGTGGSWSADCGTCIDAATGEFDASIAGDGTWTVTYTLIEGVCDNSNSMTVDVITCLSVGENDGGLISIYPNPAKNIVTINSSNITSGIIEMTDVLGRTVVVQRIESNETVIDLEALQSRSTYFVKILSEEGELIAIRKLVKS